MSGRHLVLAITGASGAIYGVRLCQELLQVEVRVTLLISRNGFLVLQEELGLDWCGSETELQARLQQYFHSHGSQLVYHGADNLQAPVASGSSAPDGMVICPCSMGTLARVANGNSGNLIERCADVMLKERRPLVLVPRETPLSDIHLENMLRLSRMGARMVPAMPAFYHQPASVAELVGFMAGKIMDSLGIANTLYKRWGDAR